MTINEIKEIAANLEDISDNIEGKTIFITGGAGFLGSWLCDVLIELNARVICVDNLASGLMSNLSQVIDKKNFTFIEHDITTPILLDDDLDVVMHLASRASPFEFEKFPIQILKANTLGIWTSLGIAKKHKARFLYTSTSEIYGNATEIPTPEEYTGNVNPIGTRSCYDEGKRCGESYAVAYKLEHGMDVRIARIFNTYGPRMRGDDVYGRVVPRFIEQALANIPITVFGDGTQTRSFCYVTDQIEALLRLAFLEGLDGTVINIGSDKEITIIALAKLIKKLTNSTSTITFKKLPEDDPLRRGADIHKAKKLLGWEPQIKLKQGLKRTLESFVMTNLLK